MENTAPIGYIPLKKTRIITGLAAFSGGLHRVEKSKFDTGGGTIVANYSLNTDSKSSNGDSLGMANDLVNDMVTDTDGNLWILLFRDNVLTKYSPSKDNLEKYDVHRLTGYYPTLYAVMKKVEYGVLIKEVPLFLTVKAIMR